MTLTTIVAALSASSAMAPPTQPTALDRCAQASFMTWGRSKALREGPQITGKSAYWLLLLSDTSVPRRMEVRQIPVDALGVVGNRTASDVDLTREFSAPQPEFRREWRGESGQSLRIVCCQSASAVLALGQPARPLHRTVILAQMNGFPRELPNSLKTLPQYPGVIGGGRERGNRMADVLAVELGSGR